MYYTSIFSYFLSVFFIDIILSQLVNGGSVGEGSFKLGLAIVGQVGLACNS